MKISIVGQDSLAYATRECCARHFDLLPEPSGRVDVLWICYDTPLDLDGKPDGAWVLERLRRDLAKIDPTVLVLVSSQMPVGTTAALEKTYPQFTFAYSPENIRVANAVADFEQQARIVVGVRTPENNALLHRLLSPFTGNIIFTDPETAEMTKCALNCYLALSIAFINEIARVCAAVGADPHTVSTALRTEARVSPKAPLRPGAPFGGGHLERELFTVNAIAANHGIAVPILASINESNRVVTG